MEDLSAQFAARDRVRRAIAARRSVEERMELMFKLQRQANAALAANPAALAHFRRRNFRKRAIQVEASHDA